MSIAHPSQRYDPYKNYPFRLKWDGKTVLGAAKVSGLPPSIPASDAVTASKPPSPTQYEVITIERGVTHDSSFQDWANKVWDSVNSTVSVEPASQKAPAAHLLEDLVLETYDEAGQKVLTYNLQNCWVSQFTAQSKPDACLVEHLIIQTESCTRTAPLSNR